MNKFLNSSIWSFVSNSLVRGLSIVAYPFLVKYYLKSDIAMFKSLQSFIAILIITIPLGSNFYYISSEKKQKAWDVTAWTSIITSILVVIIFLSYSKVWEDIFSLKILSLNPIILIFIPLTSFIKSLGITRLSREMKFKQISISLIFKQLTLYGGIIYFSFSAANLRTLLLIVISSEIIEATFLAMFCLINNLRLIPYRFFVLKMYTRDIRRYIGFIGADQIFNVLAINFPAIFVVMVMGKELAPEFQLSQYAISIPVALVVSSIAKVIFPYISRIESDKQIGNILFSVEFVINILLIPVLVAISFFGEEIISIFFDKSWENAIFMFKIFPIMMLANIFNNPFSTLCVIKNKPHILLSYSIVLLTLRLAAIYFGFHLGGFKLAVILFIIFDVIIRIIRLKIDLYTIQLKLVDFFQNLKAVLFFGAILAILTYSLNTVIKSKILVYGISLSVYIVLNLSFEKLRIFNAINKVLTAWKPQSETK
jgi:O-antigen/teichoic acid export membrane protein